MPQIAEPITSLEQELELRIECLENGLKSIIKLSKDRFFTSDLQDESTLTLIAQSILDGEPTTADKYNTMQEDEKLVFEEEHNFSPENTVRISDVNKEIAKEWNRDREKRINKESK